MVSILDKMRGGIITMICLYAIVTFQAALSSPADRQATPATQTPADDGETSDSSSTSDSLSTSSSLSPTFDWPATSDAPTSTDGEASASGCPEEGSQLITNIDVFVNTPRLYDQVQDINDYMGFVEASLKRVDKICRRNAEGMDKEPWRKEVYSECMRMRRKVVRFIGRLVPYRKAAVMLESQQLFNIFTRNMDLNSTDAAPIREIYKSQARTFRRLLPHLSEIAMNDMQYDFNEIIYEVSRLDWEPEDHI